MPLSLSDVHQTLSRFFSERYHGEVASGPVLFRFDKFGSILSEADFVDPRTPEAGPSEALAREVFSELVNRVPRDAGDGVSVVMTQDAVDDTYYYSLLAPAQRVVPPSADATAASGLLASFAEMKADAVRLWEQQTLESSSGMLRDFKPAEAVPADWFEPSSSAAWVKTKLDLSSSPADGDATSEPAQQLWRMAPDVALLSQLIAKKAETPAPQVEVPMVLRRPLALGRIGRVAARPHAFPVKEGLALTGLRARFGDTVLRKAATPSPIDALKTAQLDAISKPLLVRSSPRLADSMLRTLAIRDRIALNEQVQAAAPTAPLAAQDLDVSFEYCLVQIDRPWLLSAFLNDDHWSVPGVARGSVTDVADPSGMPYLPAGLVLVRNLEISAAWSDVDRANAATADRLGPFKVDAVDTEGSLGHAGVQAIGWMLQPLPPLPPTGDPPEAPAAAASAMGTSPTTSAASAPASASLTDAPESTTT